MKTTTQTYTPQHMAIRTKAVKDIWIKEYERERRGKVIAIIPTAIAYSIGFWSGFLGHGKGFWFTTLCISIALWYFFGYLRRVYKINI